MSFLDGVFSKNGKEAFYLIVDVGSESIGAAFVQSTKNKFPKVLGVARHVIPFQEKINMERFVLLLQETLVNVVNDDSIKSLKLKPSKIIFTLASPWYRSQTRSVHIEESEDFIVTEDGLNTILEKEKKLFLNKSNENLKNVKPDEEVAIESYITQIKIDGYEIANPLGRKTNNVDISMHIATSSSNLVNSLTSVLQKIWPNADCLFHSFMFSAFNAVRDKFKEASSYIIIDIAGEITDISLIREDVIVESISFPLGYRSYLRATMRQLSLQGDLAQSEISLFFKKELSKERSGIVDEVFEKTSHDWSLLFLASIKQLSIKFPIPRNVYLLTNDDYFKYFEKSIKSSSADIFGENQEDFRVNILNSHSLTNSSEEEASSCKDLFLCVTIIMLDKLLNVESKHNKY